jgi:hypothetical protein
MYLAQKSIGGLITLEVEEEDEDDEDEEGEWEESVQERENILWSP